MAEQRVLSIAEKAMLFNQSTRQHLIALPGRDLTPNSTIEVELPKVRLTSRILLSITGTVTVAGTGAVTLHRARVANYLRNIRLSINNGFNPFQISGVGLEMYNRLLNSSLAETVVEQNEILGGPRTEVGPPVPPMVGVPLPVSLYLEIPLTLNQRDPVGLINTANQQTTVVLSIDTNALSSMFQLDGNQTVTGSLRLTPHVESFAIPQNPNAIPDLSVLKLVHEFSQTVPAGGDVTFDLQTGLTYRKIILMYNDTTGRGVDEQFLGNISLILNQADFPYMVTPQVLGALNHRAYSQRNPAGVYIFDFTGGTQPNYGGSRDYIDTERLTEFWVRTNMTMPGRLTVITETLAKLGS